jgi:hypothetical protein
MDSTPAPSVEIEHSALELTPAQIETGKAKSAILRQAVIVFLVFTALGVLSGSQGAVYRVFNNMPAEWGRLIGHGLIDWYSVGIFSPLILWLVGRWPVKGAPWLRRALFYIVVAAAMVVVKDVVYTPFHNLYLPHPVPIRYVLAKTGGFDLLLFGAVIGVAHAVHYARSLRERELRASQLEARLSRAQLEVLRSELQPHFLFNTLHAISTLMHRNVEAADEMLTQLGDLLRLTLERRSVQEIPLQEELLVLERYLGIMRIRFQDRLTVLVDVDPKVSEVRVPMFLLQPLVENAIQHGIARRAGAGRIHIRAAEEEGALRIVVSDDGPGLTGESIREGVGLSNTRTRLQHLYGAAGGLTIRNGPTSGLEVSVTIPIQRSGASAEGGSP